MSVIVYGGLAGDRNERGMGGAAKLGASVAEAIGQAARVIGAPQAPVQGGWRAQLAAATPGLRQLEAELALELQAGERPILTMGRCAAAIATLPAMARRWPEAAVVYFDAHGDCNISRGEESYLGGMTLTAAAGEWDSGFGAGLDLANVVLVGARDLDPPELARIEAGQIRLVAPGAGLSERLEQIVAGRQVFIHLDCDVLDAGLIATEYLCPGGLSYGELRRAFEVLANCDVVGLELTEFEDSWPDGRASLPGALIEALRPVLGRLAAGQRR